MVISAQACVLNWTVLAIILSNNMFLGRKWREGLSANLLNKSEKQTHPPNHQYGVLVNNVKSCLEIKKLKLKCVNVWDFHSRWKQVDLQLTASAPFADSGFKDEFNICTQNASIIAHVNWSHKGIWGVNWLKYKNVVLTTAMYYWSALGSQEADSLVWYLLPISNAIADLSGMTTLKLGFFFLLFYFL